MDKLWVIEFRNGNFSQNLEADYGGPKNTAQKFSSKEEADDFMRENEFYGTVGWLSQRNLT